MPELAHRGERVCGFCAKDISHKSAKAKWCDRECWQSSRWAEEFHAGVSEGRITYDPDIGVYVEERRDGA